MSDTLKRRVMAEAFRQRRTFVGEMLAGSRNKPAAHQYWVEYATILDTLLKEVEGDDPTDDSTDRGASESPAQEDSQGS